MNRLLAAVLALFLAAPAVAVAQPNLSNMPANSVVGRLGIGTGPAQAIPFANLPGATGPNASTDGDVVLFSGPTGKQLKDAGGGIGSATGAFPGPNDPSVGTGIDFGHQLCWLDHNCAFGGPGVFSVQLNSSNPYVGGIGGTIASSTAGQIFKVQFTGTHLTGSPLTANFYTAVGGDTVSTIAMAFCAAVNSTTFGTDLTPAIAPAIFCQATAAGKFNLQWDVRLFDLSVSSAGTGSITLPAPSRTLDFAVVLVGRNPPGGYIGQANDNAMCIEPMAHSTSGAMDAVIGSICNTLIVPTAGAITGRMIFSTSNPSGNAQMALQSGMALYDASGNLPAGGFLGDGIINVPATGGFYVAAGVVAVTNGGVYTNNLYGGTGAGSGLNLQSTQNVSPSGDFVQIQAGNKVGYKFDGTNSTFGTAGSLVGSGCFANLTSGTICVKPPTGALGSAALTLPDATDTLIGKATTDILTNKTFDTAGTGNSFKIAGTAITATTGSGATVALNVSPGLSLPNVVDHALFSGSSSGSTNLQAAATASGTLTLPAATDTLVGKATTDTLTNKTLTTPTINQINSASGQSLVLNAASGTQVQFNVNGTPLFLGQVGSFIPALDNTEALGNGSFRWSGISSMGLITTASPLGGIGYAVGAGAAVTQITSRTTGVTINNASGAITLLSAAGSATPASFTVTNSAVAATDTVHVTQKSGTNLYETFVTATNAGSFVITFFTTGGTATDSPVFNFTVVKGVAS